MLYVFNHREMQIKATRRYHLTPIRMASVKKKKKKKENNKRRQGCGETETPVHCLVGRPNGTVAVENKSDGSEKN